MFGFKNYSRYKSYKIFFVLHLVCSLANVAMYILRIISIAFSFELLGGITFIFQIIIFMLAFDAVMIASLFPSDNPRSNPTIKGRCIVVFTIIALISIFCIGAMLYSLCSDILALN
jgi:Mn2+/Fe2+ NRAMP family transporter